ncbi:hypothetical protein L0337_24980 [candidate division KSB1 bacterium]|nr:hypothetical protein [candidate division KSB1 bacterium]
MYIRSFEGFGLGSVTYSKKYSSTDYMWSDPVMTDKHDMDLHVERKLKVRFSSDWPTFRARVKRAFGRLMTFRSDEGKFVESMLQERRLKTLHSRMIEDIAHAKDFVVLLVAINYSKIASGSWKLYDIGFIPTSAPTWNWE